MNYVLKAAIPGGRDSDNLPFQGLATGIVVAGSDLGEVLNTISVEEPIKPLISEPPAFRYLPKFDLFSRPPAFGAARVPIPSEM